MRSIAVALASLFGFYLLLVIALFFMQRGMIYPAPKEVASLPAGFEEVQFETADGLTLKAAYRAGRDGRPVAVFFHGNGDSWDGASQATLLLAQAGYGVLLPEYRGYGGNPGSPDEDGLYADGRAALEFLTKQGVGPGGTVLIGNSLGSGVAVQMATEYRPAALVLIAAFSSLPDVAAERFAWLPARMLLHDSYANIDKIGTVDVPMLILHGDQDRVVPFSHGQRLAEQANATEFIAFPGMGHELPYTEEAQQAVRDWLPTIPRLTR